MFEKLFEPIIIGGVEINNRLFIPPMVVNFCEPDGFVNEKFIKYHEERAKGGWGLITIEQSVISKQGKGHPGQPGLWSDDFLPGLSELTKRVHSAGAKINVQINHAGSQALNSITGQELVAASAMRNPYLVDTPRELTVPEIKEIVEQYGEAALRAKEAGFDMVMIHAHHGYLIGSFLSPYSNKRCDEYGGTLSNRARLLMEVYYKMREEVGDDFPIACRFSGEEFLPNEEYLYLAQMLEKAGICMIFIGDGRSFMGAELNKGRVDPYVGEICENIKKTVSIPVGGAGGIHYPETAQALLSAGKMDFVLMGRSSIADPEFPNKVQDGRIDDIRSCIDCQQGCFGNVGIYQRAKCLVNPLFGHEDEFADSTIIEKKKVLVIGGGVSGMQAAITAAERGHDVTLYEANNKLGGQWLLAAVPPFKSELNLLSYWQKRRMDQLNIKVKLGCQANTTIVESLKPDAIIVATGAIPIRPKIVGVDGDKVVQAFDVLSMKTTILPNSKIVVIGGGAVGSETAAYLASLCNRVTVIEMMDDIAKDVGLKRLQLMELLEKQKVNIITNAKVLEIGENSVQYEQNAEVKTIEELDLIVLALGARSKNDLVEELKGKAPQIITIGDAFKVQKAIEATAAGYEAAMQL